MKITMFTNKNYDNHISSFRIINQNLKNKIDSVDGDNVKQINIDEYDILFRLNSIVESNNVLFKLYEINNSA